RISNRAWEGLMDATVSGSEVRREKGRGWALRLASALERWAGGRQTMSRRVGLERVSDQAPVGIAIADQNHVIRESNRMLATLMGIPVETVLGRTVESLFAPGSRAQVTAQLNTLGRLGGAPPPAIEAKLASEGRETVVLLHLRPLPPERPEDAGALS